MRKYVFIGCGGFIGAVLRYSIKEMSSGVSQFPVSTLIINISGAFLLGLILTIACKRQELHMDIRLGLTAGLLGAFTTFSTMCKETVTLIGGGKTGIAVLYVSCSVLLGLASVYLGAFLARFVSSKTQRKGCEEVGFGISRHRRRAGRSDQISNRQDDFR